jgi:hypothetical protein
VEPKLPHVHKSVRMGGGEGTAGSATSSSTTRRLCSL